MADPDSLGALFQAVALPAKGGLVSGIRVPWRKADYVARTANDGPVVLIAAAAECAYPAINLRHLEVDFCARCRISEPKGTETEGGFVLVSGRELTPELVTLFLRVMDGVLRTVPDPPQPDEVRQAIYDAAELFRALEMPPRRDVQGLWAELFVMASSDDPATWVQAWRGSPKEKFDFAFDSLRLDVKSTQASRRIHGFSLEQLLPPDGCKAYVVSVLMRELGSGVGVLELAERLAAAVRESDGLVSKIWRNTIETLGRDCGDVSDLRFDERHARQTMRFVAAEFVPRPRTLDRGVTNVHFDSDIDEVTHQVGVKRLRDVSET